MSRTPRTRSRRRSADIKIVRELLRDRRLAQRGRGERRAVPPGRTVAVRPDDAVMRFLELTRDA